jgi:hypothetical protein
MTKVSLRVQALGQIRLKRRAHLNHQRLITFIITKEEGRFFNGKISEDNGRS